MARKATIDVEKAMQLLREGQSTQAVAEFFGVSRQAIDLHRRKMIQAGELVDKRAPRAAVMPGEPPQPRPAPRKTAPSSAAPPTLDGMIELAIQAFASLKKVPQLEAEAARYRQDCEKAARRIEELEQELKKRNEQESRWKLAMTGDGFMPSGGTDQASHGASQTGPSSSPLPPRPGIQFSGGTP